ncbi:HAD-like domain-containing protein [Mycena latifolia]|nr:HAD-like domain-containing protein [Mycena latifolia]
MADAIPESTLPYPPVYKDKRFVVLSDWDRTITTQDSNDYMTENLGFGKAKRRAGNLEILAGRQTFRDGFREMLASITANGHSFDKCKEVLKKNIKLDAGFKDFNTWRRANDIPVVIVSGYVRGLAPTTLLNRLS